MTHEIAVRPAEINRVRGRTYLLDAVAYGPGRTQLRPAVRPI